MFRLCLEALEDIELQKQNSLTASLLLQGVRFTAGLHWLRCVTWYIVGAENKAKVLPTCSGWVEEVRRCAARSAPRSGSPD